MASRRLHQDDDATTSKPDWTANPCMNYTQSRHCDGQRAVGTTGASTRKRKIAEVLGQESAEHARTAHGKRARICQEEDVFGVALDKRHGGRPGHSYRQVYSDGNARVHVGDSYAGTTINHNYFGLCAAMNMRLDQDIEPSEEAAILRLAAVIIVAAIANAIVQPFLLLQNALHRAIPHAVQRRVTPLSSLFGSRMVLFEDALGRFERIDINVVTDWTSFHYNLTRAFADQPGHRRVAVAGYRLFDHAQSTQLIDPRRPPPFASVFMRNKHVRMSIHFAWDEVSLECCPKCGLKQICELDKETTCKAKACGFSYRGHIKESPIVELEDDDDDGVGQEEGLDRDLNMEQRVNSRKRPPKNEQENPAWFSRISVSQQPEVIAIRDLDETNAKPYRPNTLGHNPTTKPVDDNVYRSSVTTDPVNVHDTQSSDTRGRAREALKELFDDTSRFQGHSTTLPAGSGESQKAPDVLHTGAKRRAQSPIALERATSNEQNNPPVRDPSSFFEQWYRQRSAQGQQNPQQRGRHQTSNRMPHNQGTQANSQQQQTAAPLSMPPPPTPAGSPQQLPSGHIPAVIQIKNQLRARYPQMSEVDLTTFATEQLKHQSQSSGQMRQNAMNARGNATNN